jgi:hypothetical protein
MLRRVSCAAVTLLAALAGRAPAMSITTPCGVEVPRGETATLEEDVVCSVDAPIVGNNGSILLRRGARLELNGHTIRLTGTAQLSPIYCEGRCTVVGPGRLTSDFVGGGIVSFASGRIVVRDVTIDTLIAGVYAFRARVDLTNVDMNVKVFGVHARRISVNDVGVNLTSPAPDSCVLTSSKGSIKGTDLRLTGCGGDAALWAEGKVDLTNLTSVGGLVGVRTTGRLRLVDSTITGSTWPGGLDIVSARQPFLTNTICGHSARLDHNFPVGPLTTWGVCSDD